MIAWRMACVALISSLLSPVAISALPTHDVTLDNGMRLIVREDARAPVVTVMTWVKAGSIDEAPHEAGIAHVLEHMLFKNTERLGPGDFSQLVARYGGRDNAFTSYDFTAYFQRYAASRLPLALELEAERFRHLRLDDDEFHREMKVVLEERRQRTDDNPGALAWEKFMAVARAGTAYANPIIGWATVLPQLQPIHAQQWYERYYVPGNTTLVIVGDVTMAQVMPLVEQYFGDWPEAPVPVRPQERLREPMGERRVTVEVPVQVPSLYMTFNVPSKITAPDRADFYALTMLAGVLDGGQSARLPRTLVREQQLLAGVRASYNGLTRGDGSFTLTATPSSGVSLDEVEAALLEQLAQVQTQPPTAQELARVRANVLASDVYKQDSNMGQAMELGMLAVLGLDLDMPQRLSEELAAVTAEDIQRVARRWLVSQRRAVAHVVEEAQ